MKKILIYFVVGCLCVTQASFAKKCWNGAPLPECKDFWITETGAYYRFDNPVKERFVEELLFTFKVGRMFNRTADYAWGGNFVMAFDDINSDLRLGFSGRGRRWLNSKLSVEMTAGLYFWGDKTEHGFISSLILNTQDYLSLALRMEILKPEGVSSYEFAWYGGLNVGSQPGLILAAFSLIIMVLTFDFSIGIDGMNPRF